MNLEEAMRRAVELRGSSLAFKSVSVGYGGFDAVVSTDRCKEIFIGVPGAFRVWLRLDGTYLLDVPNEHAVPFEEYQANAAPEIKLGDTISIMNRLRGWRYWWARLRGKPTEFWQEYECTATTSSTDAGAK